MKLTEKLTEQQLLPLSKASPEFLALQDPDVREQVEAYKRGPVTPVMPVVTAMRPPAPVAPQIAYRPLPAPRAVPPPVPQKPKTSLGTQLGAGMLVLGVLFIAIQLLLAFAPVIPYILGFLFIMGLGIHSKGGKH